MSSSEGAVWRFPGGLSLERLLLLFPPILWRQGSGLNAEGRRNSQNAGPQPPGDSPKSNNRGQWNWGGGSAGLRAVTWSSQF